MKQYQTKTGIVLELIQGEGLGDGIPRGVLQLVDDDYVPLVPTKRRFFEFVMTETRTIVRVGSFFEYDSERVS